MKIMFFNTSRSFNHTKHIIIVTLLLFQLLCLSTPVAAQNAAWTSSIETELTFDRFSVEDETRQDIIRTGKYITPVDNDLSRLQTVFQDVNQYRLHLEFMAVEFPERFAGLTSVEYTGLVLKRGIRQYFAGSIFKIKTRQNEMIYGFNVETDPGEPIELAEVIAIYNQLAVAITLRPFVYAPISLNDIDRAGDWSVNAAIPIHLPDGQSTNDYDVYSPAVNYGRVRLVTLEALNDLVIDGRIGWQDIVVVDSAPSDIETVVAGIVTGSQQGELSHVNVRSLRRGTPNAFIKDPHKVFAPYEGQLVKIDFGLDAYDIIAPVDLAEAEAWWDAHRPRLDPLSESDDDFSDLIALPDLAVIADHTQTVTRLGGKTAGLVQLYRFLDDFFLVDGFGIPFHYYIEFMRSNTIPDFRDPSQLITYEDYIHLLLDDENFRTDSVYRFKILDDFKDYMRANGNIDPVLIDRIINKTIDVFGSPNVKVRFRSSSNAEDDIEFNGAGLYDSTSVCLLDTLDGDDSGPSRCDPSKNNERTIERGLKKVWASLWNPKAFEEREFFQIDHKTTRMGILVSRAFPNEDANGVAFTGDPVAGHKDFYVINVQKGDESVVQPDTGIVSEKDLIFIENGQVSSVSRSRGSSLLPAGQWVLSNEQLERLGTVLHDIDAHIPLGLNEAKRDRIIFDIEFKFQDGDLILKQVRPSLIATVLNPPNQDSFTIRIPPETKVAGVFQEGRSLIDEYELLSTIHFAEGDFTIPIKQGHYPFDIIQKFEFGPERKTAEPLGRGHVDVSIETSGDRESVHFKFEQDFDVDGKKITISIEDCRTSVTDGRLDTELLIFDEPYLSKSLFMIGKMQVGVRIIFLKFASLGYESLPLYLFDLKLESNQSIQLYQRLQLPFAGTGPSNLVHANFNIEEGIGIQSDYWNLVYAAEHHNWNEQFWVLFDEPIDETFGLAVITEDFPSTIEVYTLNRNLQPLRRIEMDSISKERYYGIFPPSVNIESWQLYH